MIYVNDIEPQPRFRRFATFEAMREFLRKQPTGTFAVPVFGLLAYYSRAEGPTDRRYLIHPSGKIVPLFDAVEEITVDTSFMLGDADLDITPVTTSSLNGSRGRAGVGSASRQPVRSTYLEEDDIDDEESPELDVPGL